MNRNFSLLLVVLLSLFSLVGCTEAEKFSNFNSIDERGWVSGSKERFSFTNKKDETGVYDLYVVMRYTSELKNVAVKLDFEVTSPSMIGWNTIVSMRVNPSQDGGRNLKECQVKVLSSVALFEEGDYKFDLTLKNSEAVKGVSQIGLVIRRPLEKSK